MNRRSFFLPHGILGTLALLTGCTVPPQYVEHLDRASRHMGIKSTVELSNENPNTFRLRVEGNSMVPTIDVERTFDEETQKKCQSQTPIKPPHILTKQSQIINTWQGGVYEVNATFRCEEVVQPQPEPATQPLPPSTLQPYNFPVAPAPTKEEKRPKKKSNTHTKKKAKGCNCAIPDKDKKDPKSPLPPSFAPKPAVIPPVTTPPVPTLPRTT